jgi:hypothetical protein
MNKTIKTKSYFFILGLLVLVLIAGCTNNEEQNDSNNLLVENNELNENEVNENELNDVDATNNNGAALIDEFYCESNDDCECGMSVETAECAIGNRDYLQNDELCNEFCGGELTQKEISCIENKCVFN